jgi:hypothetical protein
MLNELTERNMDAWKSMQRGFLDAATQARPGGTTGTTGGRGGKKS